MCAVLIDRLARGQGVGIMTHARIEKVKFLKGPVKLDDYRLYNHFKCSDLCA